MTSGEIGRACFRLPNLYWPYQLGFAAAQVVSAVVVTALVIADPSAGHLLLAELPPVLALVSLGARGPIEKVGLVIEAERLRVAGAVVHFAEILQVSHRFSWKRVDTEAGPYILHVWKLRLQLLAGRDVTIYEHHSSQPARDQTPPRLDRYGARMAREIRWARGLYFHAIGPRALRQLREDLLEFRRYGPRPLCWRPAIASETFSAMALGAAAMACIGVAAWLK